MEHMTSLALTTWSWVLYTEDNDANTASDDDTALLN